MAQFREKIDGTIRKFGGYKKAKKKSNKNQFRSEGKKLPARVDLRPYLSEVEDQGELNSCVANAVAGAYEYLAKRHLDDESFNVSRLFVYYNARDLEGDDAIDEDEGTIIECAIDSLSEYGACSEDTWPYDEDLVNEEPDDDAYDEGVEFLVEDVQRIDNDLQTWKECLAAGYPIVFALDLYDSFESHRKRGLVPKPTAKELDSEDYFGHAMLAVGYSDHDRVFIVRNSWGPKWGDQGYCYIPYEYVLDTEHNDGDSWMIRRVDEVSLEGFAYSDDEGTFFADFESEFDNMTDDEYEEMLEAMGKYPVEQRIAFLLLEAADADDEISEEELEEITAYLEDILEELGSSNLSPAGIIRKCQKKLWDEDFHDECVELLGEYLSKDFLANMLLHFWEIVEADDLEDEEDEYLTELEEAWDIKQKDYDRVGE